ncbi:MAG: dephospho-CoA kinase [Parvularculaceae bacterium]|nr:dephospho-CoA kinase [Parvularculaceae bacterium]
MISIGLTGSIGMGKSTVTGMFADEGAMVWNADDAVHRLYAKGGAGVAALKERFPSAIIDDAVDRNILSTLVLDDAAALADLEAIIHPLVSKDRAETLDSAARSGADFVVLDIPLLFEKGYERFLDAVIVVSAPTVMQQARVMARPGMTERKFRSILMKQTPDAEKRRRADYVIDTGVSLEETREQVRAVVTALKERFSIV